MNKSTYDLYSKIGLAQDDGYRNNNVSEFESGGHYGIEISSVNNLSILKKVLIYAKEQNVTINRVDECRGISRLPISEIKEMANICKSKGIGFIMSCGARAIYDYGAFVRTKNGNRVGYRLRGMENVNNALDDIYRAIDAGVVGFLIYDEGLLFILSELKKSNIIPSNIILKLSVHCGVSNPASCILYEHVGANTINIVPDLTIPMLNSIRESVKIPLDIFTDTSSDAGGIIRTHDAPLFIEYCSPVYLKCGPVSQNHQNHLPTDSELNERIKQTRNVIEMIDNSKYTFIRVDPREITLAIPC